jgi:hypothetical protein
MSGGGWLSGNCLNEEHKNHIRKFILPKEDTTTFELLFNTLDELIEVDEITNSAFVMPPKEAIDKLTSVKIDLQSAANKLLALSDTEIPETIDRFYCLLNQSTQLDILAADANADSGTTEVIVRLLGAIDAYNQKLTKLKRRGAPATRRHAYFIVRLAEFFETHIKHYNPSHSRGTGFFKLTAYIFEHLLKEPTRVPVSQIKTALMLWQKPKR